MRDGVCRFVELRRCSWQQVWQNSKAGAWGTDALDLWFWVRVSWRAVWMQAKIWRKWWSRRKMTVVFGERVHLWVQYCLLWGPDAKKSVQFLGDRFAFKDRLITSLTGISSLRSDIPSYLRRAVQIKRKKHHRVITSKSRDPCLCVKKC